MTAGTDGSCNVRGRANYREVFILARDGQLECATIGVTDSLSGSSDRMTHAHGTGFDGATTNVTAMAWPERLLFVGVGGAALERERDLAVIIVVGSPVVVVAVAGLRLRLRTSRRGGFIASTPTVSVG